MLRVLHQVEGRAPRPERPELIDPFEAVAEDDEDAAEGGSRSARDEVPGEGEQERDERQPGEHGVGEQQRMDRNRVAQHAVLDGRREVGQPVVVQAVADPVGIVGRRVALAYFRYHRDGPDHVGGEVGPPRLARAGVGADRRVGAADDGRHDGEQEQQRREIATGEAGRTQQAAAPAGHRQRDQRRHDRRGDEQAAMAQARQPARQQHEVGQRVAGGGAEAQRQQPAAAVLVGVNPAGGEHAGHGAEQRRREDRRGGAPRQQQRPRCRQRREQDDACQDSREVDAGASTDGCGHKGRVAPAAAQTSRPMSTTGNLP